ncbi:hypothetical protein NEUTE1DRAFT_125014 [Neurospora tetrasperma FGSC 2508]|uniref:Kinesin-like protein KIF22 n=1 Tax=Neurospora tetrasperma (strain FGSC 2508 / ATCC MYA-4615 / P0657) TaxID=510951 RepID=F8MWA6_NEUT8|nr:uncharacterized protein NEUTE1DRAFT_125014 [Neurospora tetrasperma FGSC 2508]EGO54901.1 hypothetical protein NEUTE1DRAFT_125014 [Neurospora tetrasperma FGSC 2508]EGZ67607.1 hypothetical protein NEUTE2DRAFT_116756 [Neurospora tetrasperma FGSC 2509]
MSVRVVARIRPLLKKELDKDVIVRAASTDEGKPFTIVKIPNPKNETEEFSLPSHQGPLPRPRPATKLNAHSSRSHAILRVKVTQTTGDMVLESTASAIDLAGSEDNRRTDNNRDRMIESAAINKSLFVLSQCIDAISRGDKRIPYRESKMTRILSLGQNNGITIMILNLAPMRSYHLDTLSSLNVSSRAKRIEVREIENEVVYKQPHRSHSSTSFSGLTNGVLAPRQPLRPIGLGTQNSYTGSAPALARSSIDRAAASGAVIEKIEKPSKLFNVYADRASAHKATASMGGGSSSRLAGPPQANTSQIRQPLSLSGGLASRRSMTDTTTASSSSTETSALRSGLIGTGASKLARPTGLPLPGSVSAGVSRQNSSSSGSIQPPQQTSKSVDNTPILTLSAAQIEAMVEKKVAEILAARAAAAAALAPQTPTPSTPRSDNHHPPGSEQQRPKSSEPRISEEVQRRLEALERRIEEQSMSTSRSSSRRGRGGRDEKSAGLQLLLEARKAKEAGQLEEALGMYEDALGFFPGQRKLVGKIEKLKLKLGKISREDYEVGAQLRDEEAGSRQGNRVGNAIQQSRSASVTSGRRTAMTGISSTDAEVEEEDLDDDMEADVEETPEEAEARRRRLLKSRGRSATLGVGISSRSRQQLYSNTTTDTGSDYDDRSASNSDPEQQSSQEPSPRTKQLLDIVNSRDTELIKSLSGFGQKRAQDLVDHLDDTQGPSGKVRSLGELTTVPGVGVRTVEKAYEGLAVAAELSSKLALKTYYDETETF